MAKSLDGLHPTLMLPRVEAVLADPEAKAIGLYVVSAFRSIEHQQRLFNAAVRKYGSEKAARRWVAYPGKSNHGPSRDDAGNKVSDQRRYGKWGAAVDFGIPGYKAVSGQWPAELERKVNAICARHGLYSPMTWEDWHFEPDPDWTPPADAEGADELTADEREAVLTANHFVKVVWPQYAAKIDQIHQHLEVLMKGATLGNGAVIPPVPRVIFDLAEKHGIDV